MATELMFVYAHHKLPGVSDGEWVEYYRPSGTNRLRQDLTSYLSRLLELFSTSYEYGEYFAVAEFESLLESLDENEIQVFKLALRTECRDEALEELSPLTIMAGLEAVILHRISTGDLVEIRLALELFDSIMKSAIECVMYDNPRSYIRLETAAEFAPWFMDGLLEAVDPDARRTWHFDAYRTFVGETLQPLKPLLENLSRAVHQPGWPRDDLALGRFLLIVDYFKRNVEEPWTS